MNNRNTKIFIGVAIVGLILLIIVGLMYQTRANLSADEVARRFYESWVTALTKAPPSPIERNLHLHSTYVTEAFGKSVALAADKGSDAVLCLGATPQVLSFEPVVVAENGLRASVRFSADGARGRIILSTDSKGWWRIDETDCVINLSLTELEKSGSSTDTLSPATSTATTTLR